MELNKNISGKFYSDNGKVEQPSKESLIFMMHKKKTEAHDIDWEHRILCSDESCIGIIGPDGRCRECGKKYKGRLPENFWSTPGDVNPSPEKDKLSGDDLLDEEEREEHDSSEASEEGSDMDESEDLDMDWENRILCVDENCIGVIGPDGRCKECGKSYEENSE